MQFFIFGNQFAQFFHHGKLRRVQKSADFVEFIFHKFHITLRSFAGNRFDATNSGGNRRFRSDFK